MIRHIRVTACLVLSGVAVAATPPAQRHGLDVAGIDKSVAPGDDFFRYANGVWLKSTEIPADRSSYGSGAQLTELTAERTAELIRTAAANAAAGTEARKIGDYYNSFMDEVVVMAVRAFQYAWPPLAYSIRDDREAARVYAVITTYYVLVTGAVVAAATLLGRWVLRVFAAPSFYPAHEALPWVALGWALYGLFLVLVVSAGRANVTTRNFPAALAGLVVNVILLLVLVGPLGIAGAGIALCAAYLVMLAVMYALTREVFPVPFQWARLAHLVAVIGGVSVAGELLLPTSGAAGLLARCAALAVIPVLLVATGFLRPEERVRLAELWARARRRGSPERPEPRPQALP